jgi:phosphate transport system substrate-binding protein
VVADTTGATAAEPVYATPTTLSSADTGDSSLFGWAAVLELAALMLLPGLYVAGVRRRAVRKAGAR